MSAKAIQQELLRVPFATRIAVWTDDGRVIGGLIKTTGSGVNQQQSGNPQGGPLVLVAAREFSAYTSDSVATISITWPAGKEVYIALEHITRVVVATFA